MLINITGLNTTASGKVQFVVPIINLDRRYSYKIGVHYVYTELLPSDRNRSLEDNVLLCLNSNLVDRSAANPLQTIFHFCRIAKRGLIQYNKAPTAIFHSLQMYDLENAVFDISLQFSEQQVDIQKLFVQVEILKIGVGF